MQDRGLREGPAGFEVVLISSKSLRGMNPKGVEVGAATALTMLSVGGVEKFESIIRSKGFVAFFLVGHLSQRACKCGVMRRQQFMSLMYGLHPNLCLDIRHGVANL